VDQVGVETTIGIYDLDRVVTAAKPVNWCGEAKSPLLTPFRINS
jgi:hypothetical protein